MFVLFRLARFVLGVVWVMWDCSANQYVLVWTSADELDIGKD